MVRPVAMWRRASRRRRILVGALAGILLVVALIGLHTLGRFQGWFIEPLEAAELSALLAPHYAIEKPPGDGPFPTALLYHGCDGPRDNLERWSAELVASGWAAIAVDSHTPRGYRDLATWRLVCTGQLMPGPERAGDVLVSIADAARMPFVDPERLALVGMSHGGWSVTELMTLAPPDDLPVNLKEMPGPAGADLLGGVQAVVLLYPWCGLANSARHERWRHDAPILFILARDDIIAPAFECELLADWLKEQGRTVETVVYDDVTHGFDQVHRSAYTLLEFAPEATADALSRAMRFLDEAVSAGPR